jgi:hypothetical protein
MHSNENLIDVPLNLKSVRALRLEAIGVIFQVDEIQALQLDRILNKAEYDQEDYFNKEITLRSSFLKDQ